MSCRLLPIPDPRVSINFCLECNDYFCFHVLFHVLIWLIMVVTGKQMQRLVKASEKLLLAGANLNSQVSSAAKRNVAEAASTRNHNANLRIQEQHEWQIRCNSSILAQDSFPD